MPAAEDRQAKALEGIYLEMRKITKIMATMNENFVEFARAFPAQEVISGFGQSMPTEDDLETFRRLMARTSGKEEKMPENPEEAERLQDAVEDLNALQKAADRRTNVGEPKSDEEKPDGR